MACARKALLIAEDDHDGQDGHDGHDEHDGQEYGTRS